MFTTVDDACVVVGFVLTYGGNEVNQPAWLEFVFWFAVVLMHRHSMKELLREGMTRGGWRVGMTTGG